MRGWALNKRRARSYRSPPRGAADAEGVGAHDTARDAHDSGARSRPDRPRPRGAPTVRVES
jgi:hypothetical protein